MVNQEPVVELSQTPLEYFPFNLKEFIDLSKQGKKALVRFPLMSRGIEVYNILKQLNLESIRKIGDDLRRLKTQATFSASETCPATLVDVASLPLEKNVEDKYYLAVAIDTYNQTRTKGTRYIFLLDGQNRVYRLNPPLNFNQKANGEIDWTTKIKGGRMGVVSLVNPDFSSEVSCWGSLSVNLTTGNISFEITNYKI